MNAPILRYFAYAHLPEHLQQVSAPIAKLAAALDEQLPAGPEKSAGLRKLLEAKDAFVRAALPAEGAPIVPCREQCGTCAYCVGSAG